MSPLQIYSRRLWAVQNSAGSLILNNPGPDQYIIQTVTVFDGGVNDGTFSLRLPGPVVALTFTNDPLSQTFQVWTGLRIVWPAGEDIELLTDFGMDLTGHGYQLTPP